MQNQENEQAETVTKTEARQGQRGFNIRVLLISLVVIVLAFAAIYFYAEANDKEHPTVVDAPSVESNETTPSN